MKKLTDLTNPTQSQLIHRNRLWAKALRENKRKARGAMKNKCGGMCCLEVAKNVAISCGLEVAKSDYESEHPENEVKDFFGWESVCPELILPNDDLVDAADINDEIRYGGRKKGLPHSLIAECVENTFVHPSRPKWTFKL